MGFKRNAKGVKERERETERNRKDKGAEGKWEVHCGYLKMKEICLLKQTV